MRNFYLCSRKVNYFFCYDTKKRAGRHLDDFVQKHGLRVSGIRSHMSLHVTIRQRKDCSRHDPTKPGTTNTFIHEKTYLICYFAGDGPSDNGALSMPTTPATANGYGLVATTACATGGPQQPSMAICCTSSQEMRSSSWRHKPDAQSYEKMWIIASM